MTRSAPRPFTFLRPAVAAAAATAALALAAVGPAAAQTTVVPAPQNVVSLTASASVEVPRDTLTVVFWAQREGPDAGTVQAQLKQALDAALAEARKAAKPKELEVATGNFSLHPRYGPRGTTIAGWAGQAELIVEGRDVAAISMLAGRLPTMSIARVGWGLSREGQEKVEAEVTAMAIARFRAKADAMSRGFGFAGWSIREVAVNVDEGGGRPVPMMRAQAMRAESADTAPLPTEAGKASVTASVSGSVQMSAVGR
jgi:predicted secreted protein